MEQIERITQMERKMERAAMAVLNLSAALEEYEAVQGDIITLSEYYSSAEWKQDFDDDEAGKLPTGLKRGVLSEDGIYDLLEQYKELINSAII